MDKFNDYYYIIGHVRASTIGRDDDLNAHPFSYGDITLCHNGTVDKGILTSKTEESVDSAHIASYMAEHGEQAALEKLDGGFSLVWYNQKDNTLNFARNNRKPMALAFIQKKNEFYYGSEYFYLWATLRKWEQDIDGPVTITRPMVHYKFHKSDLRKYQMIPFKAYTRPTLPATNPWRAPMVHTKQTRQTDMLSDADAHDAESSRKTITRESTARGMTVASIQENLRNKWTNPTPERMAQVNRVLELKGQEVGQTVILKPTSWTPYSENENYGRIFLKSFDPKDEDTYIIVGSPQAEWILITQKGRAACRIRNVESLADNPLKILCVTNEDFQDIINGKAILQTQEEDTPTEDSKSYSEEENNSNNKVIPGPSGSLLSIKEFREYARTGCNWCADPIDMDFPHDVGWVGGQIICHKCKSDPSVNAEISGYMGNIH